MKAGALLRALVVDLLRKEGCAEGAELAEAVWGPLPPVPDRPGRAVLLDWWLRYWKEEKQQTQGDSGHASGQAARPAEPASNARDQQCGEAPGPAASPAGDAPAAAQAPPPPLKREQQQQQQQQQGSSSRGVNSPLPRLPPLRVDSEQTATASWRCSDASAQVQGSTAAGGMSEAARLAIEVAVTACNRSSAPSKSGSMQSPPTAYEDDAAAPSSRWPCHMPLQAPSPPPSPRCSAGDASPQQQEQQPQPQQAEGQQPGLHTCSALWDDDALDSDCPQQPASAGSERPQLEGRSSGTAAVTGRRTPRGGGGGGAAASGAGTPGRPRRLAALQNPLVHHPLATAAAAPAAAGGSGGGSGPGTDGDSSDGLSARPRPEPGSYAKLAQEHMRQQQPREERQQQRREDRRGRPGPGYGRRSSAALAAAAAAVALLQRRSRLGLLERHRQAAAGEQAQQADAEEEQRGQGGPQSGAGAGAPTGQLHEQPGPLLPLANFPDVPMDLLDGSCLSELLEAVPGADDMADWALPAEAAAAPAPGDGAELGGMFDDPLDALLPPLGGTSACAGGLHWC